MSNISGVGPGPVVFPYAVNDTRTANSSDLEQCSDKLGCLEIPSGFTPSGASKPPVKLDGGETTGPISSGDVYGAGAAKKPGTVKVDDLSEQSNAAALTLATLLISSDMLTPGRDGNYALTPKLVQDFIDSAPVELDPEEQELLQMMKNLQSEMNGRTVVISDVDFQ